ncbi:MULTISPECIES: aldehyde dehydrogenase family protein [unclassified Pseudomonas]|uniref:aldehyde dehydrogenase family protein n=1 Tax=unclassified Pseudomonas TaxID=196821 RepID=UPI0035BEEDB9
MTTPHYIDGHWVEGQGSDCITVSDPSLGLPFAELLSASSAQVDQAVRAARAALPAWKATAPGERATLLRGFAEQLGKRREALIAVQMRNNGKPRHEAEIDLDDAIATFAYYAELAEQLPQKNRDVPLAAPGFSARTRLEPVGVVGLIVPWNFPLVTSAWKLAPALAAGCTVVLKPSEVTPLVEQAYGEIADTLGLPAGVLNIVNGKAETGAALSSHSGLDKLSFTGSNIVGSQVMRSASAQCRPVTLELGGKSAIVVFDDCDPDQAVQWIVAGITWNAGQMCSATSRLLVQDGIADVLLPRLQAALGQLRVGNPLVEDDVAMGPLTSQAQWLKVASYFATAREEGLRCLAGGEALERDGWFVAPTLYVDVPEHSRLWSEEIFGPVLCARRFATEADAIAQANDSRFGLVATVCSADLDRAERVADELEVGHVWINSVQAVFVETSWGGTKGSGIGRELGPWGLSAYQSVKHVTRCLA